MKTLRALAIVDDRGVVRARLGLKGSGLVMGDGTEPTPLKAPGGRERVIVPQ